MKGLNHDQTDLRIPLGAVIRTDERYGLDRLFQGPRGWDYWNLLEDPKDYQDPNLWGDKRPTYFVGQLKMPPGTDLTIRGRYPRARYFNLALYRFEVDTFVALNGEDLAGWDIDPDSGSGNPYHVGADRTVKNRNYTLFHPHRISPPPMNADAWYALVNSKANDPSLDPASAPARKDARFEIFYGLKYTVAGAFMPPEKRAEIKLRTEMEGGGDPTTVYMVNYLSRVFGPVYVFRAKLPTFPDTYAGTKIMPDGQVKYWSVVTAGSAPSGEIWDGVFDMMVPFDKDGYYTILVSRTEDRPKNATDENGVVWIDWGPGEGLNDLRNRTDWCFLIMRFMVCHPDWENSPVRAHKLGTEEAVMGPYYPEGYYTTREGFEAKGPKKRHRAGWTMNMKQPNHTQGENNEPNPAQKRFVRLCSKP